jgi:hypothetical protein
MAEHQSKQWATYLFWGERFDFRYALCVILLKLFVVSYSKYGCLIIKHCSLDIRVMQVVYALTAICQPQRRLQCICIVK